MKQVLIIILTVISFCTSSNAQGLAWAASMGSSGNNDNARSIITDSLGNVYSTGSFSGTVDFDPDPASVFNLTSVGGDIYIQKLDALGNLIWAKNMGNTTGSAVAFGIDVDLQGNVYTSGMFHGSVDFDPSVGVLSLTSNGSADIFIHKLDAAGNFLWAKSFGGTLADLSYALVVDSLGNVYTTGYFKNTVDFNTGTGVFNLTSNGNDDIFIQKLDPSGNFIWAKNMGGIGADFGTSIALDANQNIYTTGRFTATVDFNPNGGVNTLVSNGNSDVFIQKLDPLGNYIWAKNIGGTSNETAYEIKIDTYGNIYFAGSFQGTTDFDPDGNNITLTSNGNKDIFIEKLDPSGSFLWAKSIGGVLADEAFSLALDKNENVYTTGYFQDTVDFDPGSGVMNIGAIGNRDVFTQKLDPLGNLLWVKTLGGGSSDYGYSVAVDGGNHVYTAGYFKGTADFDPNSPIVNLTSNGNKDIFIQKLRQCLPATGIDTQTTCGSYTWIDGNTYTANNNTATHIIAIPNTCDSVVTLNLTINNLSTSTDTQIACGSYIWIDGNTYTSSNNTAKDTLTNAVGCDSIVTLNLTLNSLALGTDIRTECSGYVWIDGNTYTTNNNTAIDTLFGQASNGCDSVLTLDLTIYIVDTSITFVNNTLTAGGPPGSSYQWIDCNNSNAPINGATNQSFTATQNGSYAVIVNDGNCLDTSACVNIIVTDINMNAVFNDVNIYPNPSNGIVNIDLGNLKNVSLKVMNVYEQVVYQKNNINAPQHQIALTQSAGLYFIEVSAEGQTQQYKIIKK